MYLSFPAMTSFPVQFAGQTIQLLYFCTKNKVVVICPAPKGMVFEPFWSENGSTLCPFWSGIGYGFLGNYREYMNVLTV